MQQLTSERNVSWPGKSRYAATPSGVRSSLCTSTVPPPSPHEAKWRCISEWIMWLASGRASCGPKTAATSSARSKPSSRAASHRGDAGVASCVRKATWSPEASSISRFRVRPCENSLLSIPWTRAPWRSAMSTEPSVEPESTTTISTSRSTSWLLTAVRTSSR
jgi:hypothetical protein